MTKNLTILTTIILTAAMTGGGTYYLTTNSHESNTQENTPATVASQVDNSQPTHHVAKQDADKPITIVVKTGVKEQRPPVNHIGRIRDLKQPTLRVMPD